MVNLSMLVSILVVRDVWYVGNYHESHNGMDERHTYFHPRGNSQLCVWIGIGLVCTDS